MNLCLDFVELWNRRTGNPLPKKPYLALIELRMWKRRHLAKLRWELQRL